MRTLVFLLWVICAGSVVNAVAVDEPMVGEAPIRRVEDVLTLSRERAGQKLSVDLTGVIVAKTATRVHQLHDGECSVSIYLELSNDSLSEQMVPGRRVRVTGVTDPGRFAPVVVARGVEDLGQGEVPAAKPVALNQLDLVRYDGQWVEVSGVVRAAGSWSSRQAMLELASGEGRVLLHVSGATPSQAEKWVDAKVSVRGLCLHYFNAKGQFYDTRIFVPPHETLRVERQPAGDPFELPVRSSGSLLRYSFTGVDVHRIHLRGTVTYAGDGDWCYIQDNEGGVLVRGAEARKVKVGEVVDVVGFVSAEGLSPGLDDALLRSRGETEPVSVRVIEAREAVDADAAVVSLEGVLKGAIFGTMRAQLWIESGESTFNVFLVNSEVSGVVRALEVGSRLSVTGVCRVPVDSSTLRTRPWKPTTFTLYARSAADLRLLAAPERSAGAVVRAVLLGAGVVAVLSLAVWAWRARRRLHEQRRQRVLVEAEFAAVLKERNRMAREIHDTVAQGLTSISVQVELARGALGDAGNARSAVGEHLALARGFVQDGLAELRRTISGLRPQIMEKGDLVSGLRKTVEQLVAGTGIKFTFEVAGTPRRLPAYLEDDLLHIGQEAVTNVIRHAAAREVVMVLSFQAGSVEFLVRDDGRGFDRAAKQLASTHPRTGFGLVGMEERIRQHGGNLEIDSNPGCGARLTVHIPEC